MTAARVTAIPAERPWRCFDVTVPAAVIWAAQEERLLEVARSLNRTHPPNEVPSQVRSHVAGGVLSDILEREIQAAAAGVVGGLPNHAIGRVAIEELSFDNQVGLQFRLRFAVRPITAAIRTRQLQQSALGTSPPIEAEVEAALASFALRYGNWVALPPHAPAQIGDRLYCAIEAWVEVEGAEAAAPCLLPGASPSDAQAGQPGHLPPGWWQVLPKTVTWQVIGTGRDCGEPYVELHYRGMAPAQTQIALRFASVHAVPATAGRLWLETPLRAVDGVLPESCSALLALGRHGPDGRYLDTLTTVMRRPGPALMVSQRPSATFDSAMDGGSVVPAIAFWFNEATPVDLRLRVGMPKLCTAGVLRLPWPEESREQAVVELGGARLPREMSKALLGVKAGDRREVRLASVPLREGEVAYDRVLAITLRRLARKRAVPIDVALAVQLGAGDLDGLRARVTAKIQRRRMERLGNLPET